MAKHHDTDPRESAETTIVSMPPAGHKAVVVSEPGHNLQFTFDLTQMDFNRDGNDLTLADEHGSLVTLQGYFSNTLLPLFILPDGMVVDPSDIFDAPADFVTGPNDEQPTPPSGVGTPSLGGCLQLPQSVEDLLPPASACQTSTLPLSSKPHPDTGTLPSIASESFHTCEANEANPELLSALIKANTGGTA